MAVPYNPYSAAGGWTGAKPTPANRPQTSTNPAGSGSYAATGVGSGGRSDDSGAPAPSGGGGALAPNQQWGTFGTYNNWTQAFSGVHGRAPNIQDEADYWDSQIFAAAVGRSPNQDEWENRYYDGGWQGGYGWRGPGAHDERFLENMRSSNQMPDMIRPGFQQWIAELPQRSGVPDWLAGYVGQVSGVTAPATPLSPTNLPASQVRLPATPTEPTLGAPPVPSPSGPPQVPSIPTDDGGGFLGLGNIFRQQPASTYTVPVWQPPQGNQGIYGRANTNPPVSIPGTIADEAALSWAPPANYPVPGQGAWPNTTPASAAASLPVPLWPNAFDAYNVRDYGVQGWGLQQPSPEEWLRLQAGLPTTWNR